MTNQLSRHEINDRIDELERLKDAFDAVVSMLAGCSDCDAPPASTLWQLLALLADYAADIEANFKQLLPFDEE